VAKSKTGIAKTRKFVILLGYMDTSSVGLRCVKVIAISVSDSDRANKFYAETLGLPREYEDQEQVGYRIGETVLMLKADWDVPPTNSPNPRVTIETENAQETERVLGDRGVVISDPVQVYDEVHWVGSFLDSEGNKLWFCLIHLRKPLSRPN
jgi:predicted enzyme related to lactoylglutathione lyase